jgi:hypothetical protein
MNFQHQRVPRVIVWVGAVGTPIAGIFAGPWGALGYLLGAAASWWNYTHLQRVVKQLADAAAQGKSFNSASMAAGVFLRLALVGGGAIVILTFTKIQPIPLLVGLFASMIAIAIEIVYELLWSTNSG